MESETSIETPTPVRAVVPIPRMSSRAWGVAWLVGCALVATVAAFAFPGFAVRYALPFVAMIATIGVRVVCARPSPTVLSFDARGMRFESRGVDRRSPWSDVARIAITQAALVIEDVHGIATRIPWSAQPDVRAILALAPKGVDFQSREIGPAKGRARFTFILWIVLLVLMIAIYSLLGRGHP